MRGRFFKDLTETYLSTSCMSGIDEWSLFVCRNNWSSNAKESICLQLSIRQYPAMKKNRWIMFDGHKLNLRSTCYEPDGPVLNWFGLSSFFANDNMASHYIVPGALSPKKWRALRFSSHDRAPQFSFWKLVWNKRALQTLCFWNLALNPNHIS